MWFQQRSSLLGIKGVKRPMDSSQSRHFPLFRMFRYAFVPFHLDDGQDRRALFCVKRAVCKQSSRRYVSLASAVGPRTIVHVGTVKMRNLSKLNHRNYLSMANETLSIAPASTSATLFSSVKVVRLMKSVQEEALH